jgi:hypothetical protein
MLYMRTTESLLVLSVPLTPRGNEVTSCATLPEGRLVIDTRRLFGIEESQLMDCDGTTSMKKTGLPIVSDNFVPGC